MTARRPGTWLVAAALALSACSSSEPGPAQPSPTGSRQPSATATTPTAALDRFYDQHLDWHGCGGGFECTRVTVPLDYTRPDGPTLRLAVNRLPASGDDRIGSLLVNPGGPGVSGLDYARAATSIVSPAVRQRYDVVGFDPRGVGASHGLHCLSDRQLDAFLAYDGSPDNSAEEQGLVHQGEVLAAGCEHDDAALLAHMGTRDAARDLDVLRAVLGDKRLTYLGKSYGTYLGATYAGLFPNRVGRLVLDGPIDPALSDVDIVRGQAVGFQRALDAFVDDCLRGSNCPLSGDRQHAEERLKAFLDGVDGQPLPGLGSRKLTQSLAVLGVAVALYDEGSWSFLRQAIASGLRGDGDSLMLLADFYADRGPGGHYTSNANEAIYAVNCLDRPPNGGDGDGGLASFRADAAALAKPSPIFGPYIVWGNLPCTTWPVPAEGTPAPIAAPGARPILVVGTTRDPATPYEWAKSLAGELDSGMLLTYVGDGHTAYRRGSTCVDSVVDGYLLGTGRRSPDGRRCR